MARSPKRALSGSDAKTRAEKLDAIMTRFDREMAVLRKRQRELLKKVMARMDREKQAEIKSKL